MISASFRVKVSLLINSHFFQLGLLAVVLSQQHTMGDVKSNNDMADKLEVLVQTANVKIVAFYLELENAEATLEVATTSADKTAAKKEVSLLLAQITGLNDKITMYRTSMENLRPKISRSGSSADDSARSRLPTPDAEDKFVAEETDLSNFYETLEAKLLAHSTPKSQWYKMLGKVTSDVCLRWVKVHILQKDPAPTWEEAKNLFSAEYTPQNYPYLCRTKLLSERQGNALGSLYMRRIEQLALGAGQVLDEKFFLHTILHTQLNKTYLAALAANMGEDMDTADFSALKAKIAFLDGQDLSHYRQNVTEGKTTTTTRNTSTTTPKRDRCKICRRTTHTTEECTKNSANTTPDTNSAGSSSSSSRTPPARSNAHITCFTCQNKGHYAGDPSCPGKLDASKLDVKEIRKIMALREETKVDEDEEITNEMIANALFELNAKPPLDQ